MTKKKQLLDKQLYAKSNEKYFHYSKKEYYMRDYHSGLNWKSKDKKTVEKAKRAPWQRRQKKKKAVVTQSWSSLQVHNNDDDSKIYPSGKAIITKETNKSLEACYLDSCASRHIYNNKLFFSDLHLKSYKFVIAGGEIIRSDEMGTIHFHNRNRVTITLNNVTYIP